MKPILKKLEILIVNILTIFVVNTGICLAGQDSPYDQAQGTSGDSYRAKQQAEIKNYEAAKEDAQMGFDTKRSSNLGHGNYYIPEPKPVIEKKQE